MANPRREEGPGAFADARVPDWVQHFPESVIREMTRLANRHGAVNLSQGFPDFDPPEEILGAARDSLAAIGFKCAKPEGSTYIMADIRPLTDKDDVGFRRFFVRFAFPKRIETPREATKRLEKVAG